MFQNDIYMLEVLISKLSFPLRGTRKQKPKIFIIDFKVMKFYMLFKHMFLNIYQQKFQIFT
jgi:hypothetical protein